MEMLLDTLKWSVIVGAAALGLRLLRPVFEKHYSARWRYWLWLALAALALLAPVQWEKLLPDAPAVHTPLVIDVPEMEVQVVQGERVSLAVQPAASTLASDTAARRTWKLADVLLAVWLTGAAVFALYTLAGAWLFRRRTQRWSCPPEAETLQFYEAVWRDMGLKKAPPLRISGAVGSPMLLGMLRPCLLLPSEGWDTQELVFILRHELTHYKRHDLWYKLVLLAANAVHWFNPLLYLLVKEAGADLELTCDDAVVAGMSREARRAYSEALLSAIRREKGPALSTHFYGGKAVMKERFRNILSKRSRKWGALALALTLLVTVVSACAVGLRQTNAEPDAQPEGPEQTGASDGYGDAVIYSAEELSLVLPAEYADTILVNPDSHPGFDYDYELFTLFHKDTYLNEEPSLYDGRIAGITRYTEDEFAEQKIFVLEYGYPFATDSEGRIYCIMRRHDVVVPPEAEDFVESFVADENLHRITDAFLEYNQLPPFDPPAEPLTEAELAALEDYFNNDRLHNGLLRFPYDSFEDVKPYFQELFYDAGEPVTDDAERGAASELFEEGLETDCVKLSTDFILRVLESSFVHNYSVDEEWFDREMGPDMLMLWGPYIPEYDAYYTQHGDTSMVQYSFTKGERNYDDSVTLYYTGDIYIRDGNALDIEWAQPMKVRLCPRRDSWAAVSNVKETD